MAGATEHDDSYEADMTKHEEESTQPRPKPEQQAQAQALNQELIALIEQLIPHAQHAEYAALDPEIVHEARRRLYELKRSTQPKAPTQ